MLGFGEERVDRPFFDDSASLDDDCPSAPLTHRWQVMTHPDQRDLLIVAMVDE